MIKRSPGAKRRSPDPTATPSDPAAPGAGKDQSRPAEVGERIGRELRAMFADVVADPVPEKFRSLLEELERKSRKPEP